jgi:hypothetical protein
MRASRNHVVTDPDPKITLVRGGRSGNPILKIYGWLRRLLSSSVARVMGSIDRTRVHALPLVRIISVQ